MKRSYITGSERALKNMTYRDLQKECILRGIEFNKVSELDFYGLSSWFDKNFNNPIDKSNLLSYDEWFEAVLKERITEKDNALLSSNLRFSITVEEKKKAEKELPKKKEVPKVKIKKTKKKDKFGIKEGTKKSLVYHLVEKGKSVKMIIKKVKKEFPKASENSIKIWYKKALKVLS